MLRRRTHTDASRPLACGTRADGLGTGWVNEAEGRGSAMDRQKWTGYSAGCELDQRQTEALMKTNAIARRMARRPGEDSNREGHIVGGSVQGAPINVQVGGPPLKKGEPVDPFASWVQRFGLHRLIIQADSQALAHGRALWVYNVDDGRLSSEPIDMASIRSLRWVRVVSREQGLPVAWETNEDSRRFELPTHYQVSFSRSGGSRVYHWTRVWDWDGVDISDDERTHSTDGAGGSVFDLAWSALRNYGVSQDVALEALTRLSQAVWQNDNLARAVDGGHATAAAKQYERVTLGGGQFADYVLAKGESYSVVGRPLGGVDVIMGKFAEALVAASPMSEPVIMGTQLTVSGLNPEADGLIRAWYDTLASESQPERMTPPLLHFYTIASRAHDGPTGGVPILDLGVGWPPLWQLTPAEMASTRAANASARATDLIAAVVSVGEARSDKTLIDEYELAPEGVSEVLGEEPEVQAEELEVADADLMPPGERPLSLLEARDIIGVKSNGGVLAFVKRTGTPLFRPGAAHRVFESHLRAAMRESQVV